LGGTNKEGKKKNGKLLGWMGAKGNHWKRSGGRGSKKLLRERKGTEEKEENVLSESRPVVSLAGWGA